MLRKDELINAIKEYLKGLLDQRKEFVDILDFNVDIQNMIENLYRTNGWTPVDEGLPPHSDDLLLIQCSGKPRTNITLHHALCLASYTEEGWILEMYPEWDGAEIVAWQQLPECYKSEKEKEEYI